MYMYLEVHSEKIENVSTDKKKNRRPNFVKTSSHYLHLFSD